MGHHIDWDNKDKTVVIQAYTPVASNDDLYQLARKSADMLLTVRHTVHLIIDERNFNLVLSSNDMKYLERFTPRNQGAVVMVVQPAKLPYKTAVQGVGKILGPNAFAQPYFVESVEAAREFLQASFNVVYPTHTSK